jgi:hypothetical protein
MFCTFLGLITYTFSDSLSKSYNKKHGPSTTTKLEAAKSRRDGDGDEFRVCCYTSKYYNISYHRFSNKQILSKAKTKGKGKSIPKRNIKKYIRKLNDDTTVTIIKYRGEFYVYYSKD